MEKMTIDILNDDCLLKVFELLDIVDCINIAETCNRLAFVMDTVFSLKFSSLKCTSTKQDMDFIDRMLHHVGKHLKSISVSQDNGYLLTQSTLHPNLKSLFLRHWKLNPKIFPFKLANFQHIESLSLKRCDLRLNRDFFETFHNIKVVNFSYCRGLHNKSLAKFFQKNDKIRSFTFECKGFNKFPLGSLALLPNLERVYFLGLIQSAEYLEQLSQLKSLKKLKLWTRHLNRNNFSKALLKLDSLEELEIRGFIIDESIFSSLQNFHELKLFSLTFPRIFLWKWKPSFILPTNITSLKLEGVYITVKQIASIICELPKLKLFHMNPQPSAIMDNNEVKIDDFKKIVYSVFGALNVDDSMRIVNVILFNVIYSAEEIRLGGLRFFGKHPNDSRFGIDFPDCEELMNG